MVEKRPRSILMPSNPRLRPLGGVHDCLIGRDYGASRVLKGKDVCGGGGGGAGARRDLQALQSEDPAVANGRLAVTVLG